jgi:energy-coupling factor transporter ATP-binding protein EcfA2
MSAITMTALTKVYPGQPEPAVDSVSLEIPRGEIAVLVGPSGCGKTTTLKMINRLIEPTSGRIHIDGDEVTLSGTAIGETNQYTTAPQTEANTKEAAATPPITRGWNLRTPAGIGSAGVVSASITALIRFSDFPQVGRGPGTKKDTGRSVTKHPLQTAHEIAGVVSERETAGQGRMKHRPIEGCKSRFAHWPWHD